MPAAPEIEDAFRQLETVYYTARTGLVALFDSAQEPGVVIPPQKDVENQDQAARPPSGGEREEKSSASYVLVRLDLAGDEDGVNERTVDPCPRPRPRPRRFCTR